MGYDAGVSAHEWEARWQAIEPDLEDSPLEALRDAADLLDEMAGQLQLGDDPAGDEVSRDLAELRNTARRADAGESVSSEEREDAVDVARELHRDLLEGAIAGGEPPQPEG